MSFEDWREGEGLQGLETVLDLTLRLLFSLFQFLHVSMFHEHWKSMFGRVMRPALVRTEYGNEVWVPKG